MSAEILQLADHRPRVQVRPNRAHPYTRRVLEDLILDAAQDGAVERDRIIGECERERGHNAVNMSGADWSSVNFVGRKNSLKIAGVLEDLIYVAGAILLLTAFSYL
jgi:hypothetical protein